MKKTRLEAKWNLLRLVDCNFDDTTSFLTLTTKENISKRNEFKDLLKHLSNALTITYLKLKKAN